MKINKLKINKTYIESMEDSHTNGELIYVGEIIQTANGETWYGFEEPTWGFRWLNKAEILKLLEKENK